MYADKRTWIAKSIIHSKRYPTMAKIGPNGENWQGSTTLSIMDQYKSSFDWTIPLAMLARDYPGLHFLRLWGPRDPEEASSLLKAAS